MLLAIIGIIFVIMIIILIFMIKKMSVQENEQETRKKEKHPIWDMHCHILPGVDDGADCMQTALDMIWKDIREGVTDIMLTPHYISGKTDVHLIQKKYMELLNEINTKEYPVRLYLGNEILFDSDTVNALKEGRALTLAGTSYVLVEFSTSIPYQKMKNDFMDLQMAGYRPILAHLERFSCLWEREERIEELIHQGVLMQVNSNSFINERTTRFVTSLAEKGMVHFIGTDSHSMDWRPPQMRDTVRYLKNRLTEEEWTHLFYDNPYRLLNNKII